MAVVYTAKRAGGRVPAKGKKRRVERGDSECWRVGAGHSWEELAGQGRTPDAERSEAGAL